MSIFSSGLGGFLGGLFGNSGKPYDKAMQQYQQWMNRAQDVQQPYMNAGTQGLGNYQDWLSGMKNPSQFINDLMGNYQASPYTQFLQQQAQNAGINSGSASGLTGSSALAQQMQQNATNIAQQGIDSWLQNVLGINNQYGQGQQNLINFGQNSANSLSNLYNQMGQNMGQLAFGKEAGRQNNLNNIIGGGLGILTGLGFL